MKRPERSSDSDTRLDAAEVVDWLNGITQLLSQSLGGGARQQVVEELRRETGALRVPLRQLLSLALLDDCLRVGHIAAEADGSVEREELLRILPIAQVAVRLYFSALPHYDAFGDPDLGTAELTEFLRTHRRDSGAFGYAGPAPWRGLRLCTRIAGLAGDAAATKDHERMLVRVMDEVFAGRESGTECAARERLRALFESPAADSADPRAAAFCHPEGPEVFTSVAHGSQIFERDPFDVESIHGEARAVFQRQLEHAITPIDHDTGHGRTLLVLGAAGSGKTHLLRTFRAAVHEARLGYAGYLQMSSDVGDYARYVLTKLIDSLERPYDAPDHAESSLMYLSDGLVEAAGVLPPSDVERLRTGELEDSELPTFVGRLVDRLVRAEELATADSDLVHALLLLQRRDPALQRRVVKFLRCESLTTYEQQMLGGLAPKLQPEDPERMIVQLGHLAFALQQAALVLLIDQIEDAIPDATGHDRVRRAVDTVRRIADSLPSAVVVIACLEDVYQQIRPKLNQSVIDRLEREPPPLRLSGRRTRDEVESMLVLRLQHFYEALDVRWRDDDPLFPFQAGQLDELSNQQARDCLAFFHKHQQQCIAAGALVPTGVARGAQAAPATPAKPTAAPIELVDLARAWNDALVEPVGVPEDDAGLLRLVDAGIRACGEELAVDFRPSLDTGERARLRVVRPGHPTMVVEVCNRQAQGGQLNHQLTALRSGLRPGEVAVALRTTDFSFGPKTMTARQLGEMRAAGGMALKIEDSDLRATAAFEAFVAAQRGHAGLGTWRTQQRPIASLMLFRKLLALDNESRAVAPPLAAHVLPAPPVPAPPPPLPPAIVPATGTVPIAMDCLRLGVTPTMRAEPVTLDVEALKVHAAVLGTTGSGKTTIALNVVEQLLERGISVLLVDRKGDLARYASSAWWNDVPADPAAARRKRDLRARVIVDLYTPGDPSGRPLRIPIVPNGMHEMSTQERDQVAKASAAALGAMIGYGKGDAQRKREAILKKAIELHTDTAGATLDDLRDTISRPDPELLAAVGDLQRHFGSLAEDLTMLAIQRGNLLAGDGEALDVAEMLTPRGGRARLAIVSAVALSDVSILQFFVSRLMVDLARLARRNPQPTLRSVAFFDEADTYIPAVSAPPTKEPMFELLRRARAGGLGILLATQNPGDLDYKARDNINTWLIGRVAQTRAIDKMRNLLNGYPNVAARLANQTTGSFFLLNPNLGPTARELRADSSLMRTEQVNEHEISALARTTMPAPA